MKEKAGKCSITKVREVGMMCGVSGATEQGYIIRRPEKRFRRLIKVWSNTDLIRGLTVSLCW